MKSLYELTEDSELSHFGIPGMHWYQRRFQNPDGSLTDEGRKRYAKGEAAKSTAKKVATGAIAVAAGAAGVAAGRNINTKYVDAAFTPGKDGKASRAEKITKSVDDLAGTALKAKNQYDARTKSSYTPSDNISLMSDSELRSLVQRMQLEQQYKQLDQNKYQPSDDWLRETLEVAGIVTSVGLSAVSIAAQVAAIRKAAS